ncbi:MAG TPA: alpha/beta family hydrolase [Thermoanaerobaculia bacterium]|nr:alpha/beta family hydrolase [Thermoanaerobaculia bacterium]
MSTEVIANGREARIPIGEGLWLEADVSVPVEAKGVVIFAHGSGSSRHSPRNQFVARDLNENGLATVLTDLLTMAEENIDNKTHDLRFDIPLLSRRVERVLEWAHEDPQLARLAIGIFGASTGAAAALGAAAMRPDLVRAVVSRGGRPDLSPTLDQVAAPTLLIVGGRDPEVIRLNEMALRQMKCAKALEIVAGATHLFEEHGTLEKVAELAGEWFLEHLQPTIVKP